MCVCVWVRCLLLSVDHSLLFLDTLYIRDNFLCGKLQIFFFIYPFFFLSFFLHWVKHFIFMWSTANFSSYFFWVLSQEKLLLPWLWSTLLLHASSIGIVYFFFFNILFPDLSGFILMCSVRNKSAFYLFLYGCLGLS